MNYKIWAEVYRPQKLSEIIDQKHAIERIKAFVKGGNIPHMLFAGPAGVGKCVSSETPIILRNGKIVTVKEIKRGDRILSLDVKGRIKPKIVNDVIKRTDKVLKVESSLGAMVEVTAEHPFLTLENGLPKWKEAVRLKENDWVATPLILNIDNDIQATNDDFIDYRGLKLWAKVKKKIKAKVYELYEGIKKDVLKELFQKDGLTNNELSRKIKKNLKIVSWATRELYKEDVLIRKGKKPIKYFLKSKHILTNRLPLELVENVNQVERISHKDKYLGFSIWIKVFLKSAEFYEWLGMILSEGTIQSSRIIFYNTDERLLKRFVYLTKIIFGINPEEKENCVEIKDARTIVKILQKKFNVYSGKEKSYNITIPQSLFSSPKDKIASFIRAYFDGDGSIYRNYIEISSRSWNIVIGLKILLLRFGIISKVDSRKINGKMHYRLTISGQRNVNIFKNEIGSLKSLDKFKDKKEGTNKDIMEISPLVKYVMKKLSIRYRDVFGNEKVVKYLLERGRGSRKRVQKFYKKVVEISREKLSELLDIKNSLDFFLQKLQEVDSFDGPTDFIFKEISSSGARSNIEDISNIRSDRLLEYARRDRTPDLKNFFKILKALAEIKKDPLYERLYQNISLLLGLRYKILKAMAITDINYKQLSENVGYDAGSINYILNRDGLSLQAISHLYKIVKVMKSSIEDIIFDERLINALEVFEFLSNAIIFWDKVKKVKVEGHKDVYDLAIKDSHNFIGGHGFFILHNTATALAIAHELYGKLWQGNTLELNASDERGIDIIRNKVKNFARTKTMSKVGYRIIILDEADALTAEAQQALRRTMETYSTVSRFILICNWSSKIIEPIQSRCAMFRFRTLSEPDQLKFLNRIVKGEKLKIDNDAKAAIIYLAEGDLRKVANLLQAAAALNKKITEQIVYDVASQAKPGEVKTMVDLTLKGKFDEARRMLHDMLLKQGLSGEDIIREIHKQIYSLDITEQAKVELIEKTGEYEYRLSQGGNDIIQLEALLAQFLLFAKG